MTGGSGGVRHRLLAVSAQHHQSRHGLNSGGPVHIFGRGALLREGLERYTQVLDSRLVRGVVATEVAVHRHEALPDRHEEAVGKEGHGSFWQNQGLDTESTKVSHHEVELHRYKRGLLGRHRTVVSRL